MNVSLTPELEKFVQQKVDQGLYSTASEVVRDGLRLLTEREQEREAKLVALRQAVGEGVAELKQGRGVAGKEAFAAVRARRGKSGRGAAPATRAHP